VNVPEFSDIAEAAYGRKMDYETFWRVFKRRFQHAEQADKQENVRERSRLFQLAMRDLACCHAYGDEQLKQSLEPSPE
jgi:hypothetical protein